MRSLPRHAVAVCALTLFVFGLVQVASGRPSPPESLPISVMSQPNGSEKLSIDSGLKPVEPCDGAAEALRPTWLAAARAFNLRWQILAAITKIESAFGCNMGPSSAGAIGWTQFIPSTWARWGMDADGDGKADPYNSVDAVFSTARYLRVTGAPQDYRKAIFAYNHADWYVRDVLETAETFGDFSGAEFQRLARLTREGEKLRDELLDFQERLEAAEERERTLDRRVRRAQRRLDDGERLLDVRGKQFQQSKAELNQATLEYISLTQGVAMGPSAPADPESALLDYMVDARPQDAALVYQSARGIMNQQTEVLDRLRDVAQRNAELKAQVEGLVAERAELLEQRRDDLREQRDLVDERQADLRRAERKYRQFKRTERRYRRLFMASSDADLGPFLEGPFSGLTANRNLRGKLRWPVNGSISSRFSPNRCLAGVCRPHKGVDVSAPEGRPIHAAAAGRVSVRQTEAQSGGYGNFLCIDHGGNIETCYAHMSAFRAELGERVKQDEVIGLVGNTGRSFGAHLHFEVRVDGVAQDPMKFMP